MATMIDFLSLTGLTKYDQKIKAFIEEKVAEGDAKSFKYVNLDGGVLKFYTVNPITDDTVADFEITLPEQDLSHLMVLVKDATAGNIATFGENGQVVDSGVALGDLATREYVGEIPTGYTETTIVGFINKKAEETLAAASGGSTESAASVLAALNTYKSENDPKVEANTEAIEAIEADYLKKADKDELAANIKANTDAIEVLNGDTTVEGSVDKKVADAINEFATQISDNGTIDTFKELVNYVSTHGGEAAEMASAIDALETLVGEKSVATQIAEAIAAENLDQYATDEELAAAIARIVVLEGKAHEHENKEVLDGITAEKVTAWDASEENAKKYADEKVAAIDLSGIATNAAAIEGLEGTIGEVAEGKTVVQMIADAKAEATYDDTEVKADVAENASAIETLTSTHATDKAAFEAKDAEIAGNVTKLQEDVAALQEIQHVEITEEQINALFEETV